MDSILVLLSCNSKPLFSHIYRLGHNEKYYSCLWKLKYNESPMFYFKIFCGPICPTTGHRSPKITPNITILVPISAPFISEQVTYNCLQGMHKLDLST